MNALLPGGAARAAPCLHYIPFRPARAPLTLAGQGPHTEGADNRTGATRGAGQSPCTTAYVRQGEPGAGTSLGLFGTPREIGPPGHSPLPPRRPVAGRRPPDHAHGRVVGEMGRPAGAARCPPESTGAARGRPRKAPARKAVESLNPASTAPGRRASPGRWRLRCW